MVHRNLIGRAASTILVGFLILAPAAIAQTPTFTNVTVASGLAGAPNSPPFYTPIPGDHHGPGGIFADLDNDGYPELYLVDSDPLGSGVRNRLYLNVPGAAGGRVFQEQTGPHSTAASRAADQGDATGAIAGDYDNDGDLDIYVLNFDQPNVLYQNQWAQSGALTFVDVTLSTDPTPGVFDNQFGVGTAISRQGIFLDNSLTAAWSDVDRDGDLDLYVGNHNGWAGVPLEGPFNIPGRRDVLYLNNGNGTFTDATVANGAEGFIDPFGNTQLPSQSFSSTNAVQFADFNLDGWPDLLVTNKIGGLPDADMLYLNQQVNGAGVWQGFRTFTWSQPNPSPPPFTFGIASPAAMGLDVADADNDGDMDAYITDIGGNDLFLNNLLPSGTLDLLHINIAPAGFSWGTQFFDADNNGWLDLHVATNAGLSDFLYFGLPTSFADVAAAAGVNQTMDSRGDMTADYNRDGWVDLMVVNVLALPALYQNNSAANFPGHGWFYVKLIGDPNANNPFNSTSDAIGARVEVTSDLNNDGIQQPNEIQYREVVSGSSNAGSTSSLIVEFGIALAPQVATLTIRWPSGQLSVFNNVAINQCVLVNEITGTLTNGGC